MLKQCKTKEMKFQQLQWKEQGKDEDNVKDEQTRLKRIKNNGNRHALARDHWEWKLYWKPRSSADSSTWEEEV